MKIKYLLNIENPKSHYVKIRLSAKRNLQDSKVTVYMPSWSPGSYFMREYGRFVRNFRAQTAHGDWIFFQQIDKCAWELDFSVESRKETEFYIEYNVYCHDLSVRTSHVDVHHAFLHGPSLFMSVAGQENVVHELEIRFPRIWSKISTVLEDISPRREIFIYSSKSYERLIDCPIEIGNHETDGFRVSGIDHEIAIFSEGSVLFDFKKDLKLLCEVIAREIGEIPFKRYLFIIHLYPNAYGGLEHSNCSVIQFDSRVLKNRKSYIDFLILLSHEYFHAWNGKRVRPLGLGPYNLRKEADTSMLWLSEGLTTFFEDFFLLKAGIVKFSEYLCIYAKDFQKLKSNPGRFFHSLEDSGFNAWNVFYRDDENINNSSINYYLKGRLVFFVLHIRLLMIGKDIISFFKELWSFYNSNQIRGIAKDEFLHILESFSNSKIRDDFEEMLSTTKDINFSSELSNVGLEFQYEQSKNDKIWWGLTKQVIGERIFVKSVSLDGPAFRYGINAGDELIAINNERIDLDWFEKSENYLKANVVYKVIVSRNGILRQEEILFMNQEIKIKSLEIRSSQLASIFY